MASATNRPRHVNGRFRVVHQSRSAQNKRFRQDAYKSRNLVIGELQFEKFMDAVFLPGSENDWIPAATPSGPMVELAETLIKKKYLISRMHRARCSRVRYFDGCITKKQDDLPKMEVREAGNPRSKKRQERVYRKRRFPFVNRKCQELSGVQEWIKYAIAKGCLTVDTQVDAYNTFRKIFMTYKYSNGKGLYTTYPSVVRIQSTQSHETPATEQRNNVVPVAQLENGHQHASHQTGEDDNAIRRNITTSPDTTPVLPSQPRQNPAGGETGSDEDHQRMMTHTARMLDAAQDDRVFYLLCGLIDENGSSLSGIFAACALERSVSELRSKPLIQDILEYSRGKFFGVKNLEAHLARNERIEMNVAVLKAARRMYGLSSYGDMKWRAGLGLQENAIEPLTESTPPLRNVENNTGRRRPVRGGLHGALSAGAGHMIPE